GYGIADADAISPMTRIRQPFNVNSLAQAAGLAALEDDNHVLECVRMIEAGRHFLYDEFKALGIRYVPSRANFILVDVGRSASDIYQRLLKEGVIVRPTTPTASCSRPPCSRTSACWNRSGAACPPEPSSPMSAPPSAASWPSPSGWAPDARSRSSAAIPWPARRRAAGRSRGATSSAAPP